MSQEKYYSQILKQMDRFWARLQTDGDLCSTKLFNNEVISGKRTINDDDDTQDCAKQILFWLKRWWYSEDCIILKVFQGNINKKD